VKYALYKIILKSIKKLIHNNSIKNFLIKKMKKYLKIISNISNMLEEINLICQIYKHNQLFLFLLKTNKVNNYINIKRNNLLV